MIIKEVKHIQDGDILASPVLTEEKEILLEAGTVLKKSMQNFFFQCISHMWRFWTPMKNMRFPICFLPNLKKNILSMKLKLF